MVYAETPSRSLFVLNNELFIMGPEPFLHKKDLSLGAVVVMAFRRRIMAGKGSPILTCSERVVNPD